MNETTTIREAITAVKLYLASNHDYSPYNDYIYLGLTQIEAIIRDYEHALHLYTKRETHMEGDLARKLYIDTRFGPVRRHVGITAQALRDVLDTEDAARGLVLMSEDDFRDDGHAYDGTEESARVLALRQKVDEHLWRLRKCQAPLLEVIRALGAMTRKRLVV